MIVDTIIYGNTAASYPGIYSVSSTPSVEYCDVEGGTGESWFGTGCIDTDPLFVSAPSNDFNLQPTSPCVDAGNPASPSDPDGTRADMGALYFHQAPPAFTLSVTPDPLVVGQLGTFAVTNGNPAKPTWLIYSLWGTGSYYLPILDVTIGLHNAVLILGPKTTNGAGALNWYITVPGGAAGRNFWFQALQYGQATNVVATSVQ